MAKRLLRNTLNSISNKLINNQLSSTLGNISSTRKIHTKEIPVQEIKIPVKWGHIAAKLWGDSNERPILALHGWQDNAGTWDPLIPLLKTNRPILAIDFPGHGFSSWLPPGIHYYSWEIPQTIIYLKEHMKWDKVSLLCHSMGSIGGLRFASLFPNFVDFYIAVDSFIYDDYDLNFVVERYPVLLQKMQECMTRPADKEPPSYTIEELTNLWHIGTKKSVALESVKYLFKRGCKPSAKNPNKYYFSRDPRLKYNLFTPEDKMFVEKLVRRVKSPTLYLKAIDSPFSVDQFTVQMREVLEKNNENFVCQFVPGTHHVHLNNPEVIAPLINNFWQKYSLNV